MKKERAFSRETEILHQGAYLQGRRDTPENAPIYLTTAFNVDDLDDLEATYAVKGYTYNRTRNPNRNALAELMTYLEKGQRSIICGSGMAAISTILLSMLASGDHLLADSTLYGECITLFQKVFPTYGIEVTLVDFTDREAIQGGLRPNTKVLYTETISNPMITVVDIEAVAEIAHQHQARLVVDNTFTTSVAMKPLELGADVSINSLTKFANGHSDAVAGSATGSEGITFGLMRVSVGIESPEDLIMDFDQALEVFK
jgi:cystathionine beta-lyase/cystathionine gamma-synthase